MSRHRASASASVLLAAISLVFASAPATDGWERDLEQLSNPQEILRRAQAAVAQGRTTRVRSLVLNGVVRSGLDGVTGKLVEQRTPLQVQFLLPDCYLSIVTRPEIVMQDGFCGSEILGKWTPTMPGVTFAHHVDPSWLKDGQAEMIRYVAGMTAQTDSALKVRVKLSPAENGYYGLELSVGESSVGVLDIDRTSLLPIQVRYQGKVSFPKPLTREEARRSGAVMGPVESVEMTLAFSDRKPVDGFLLPSRMVRSAKGASLSDASLDRIQVNPQQLTRASFK